MIFEQVNDVLSPVYLVGGSVRDMLMGREPDDYDFTTPLTPEEIEECIKAKGKRVYRTGQRFGTLGFTIAGQKIEVTSFRKEQYQQGSRKPAVEFTTDIFEDLSRRDFTMNAIALSEDGGIIDPYGGRGDIDYGVLRAVGNPTERFQEDPLRMLRGIRFIGQLYFSVHSETINAIRSLAPQIVTVSKERWMQELDKIFAFNHDQFYLSFTHWYQSNLMKCMLPETSHVQLRDIKDFLMCAPRENDIAGRWKVFFEHIRKWCGHSSVLVQQDMIRKTATHFKWSKERLDAVLEWG